MILPCSASYNSLRPQEHLHVLTALGVATLLAIFIAGLHKRAKQRMRLQWF